MKERFVPRYTLGCLINLCKDTRPTYTCGDYGYALLDGGTAEIVKYRGEAEALQVPESLDGHTVTALGEWAFSDCDGLTSVTLPDSLTTIDANPFIRCTNLSKIIVSPDHPALAAIDGALFSKADSRLICWPYAFTRSEYIVPQGTKIIGNRAFFGCEALTAITLPEGVTAIGDRAFYGCSGLTDITLPDSLTNIGDTAFLFCTGLSSISLPDSLTTIGEGAFSGCTHLASVTLPDGLSAIGDGAFDGCRDLTLTVGRDSYAWQYCVDNDLNYTYPDANDWLNG